MELTINVEGYISESDIKEICKQSVRSYIDKQISQFTNIKDFISEAVYGSISGEFLYFNEVDNLRVLGNIYENKELINETTEV